MPMPRDIKRLHSLLDGLSYYRKFLLNMAKCVRPITALLKKEAAFTFTSSMEEAVRALHAEFATLQILVFPDWDAVIDKSRYFHLHCHASPDSLGATPKQEHPDGSIRPIVYISQATLTNERNWTPMEFEAGCFVWSIRRHRRYLLSVVFLIFTDHECLQQINKIGECKPRIFNAGCSSFQSITTVPHKDEDGKTLTLTSFYTTPSCPSPGVDLGGLAPPSYKSPGTGTNPFPTPVLGGLPVTKNDFRTHRAPMPLMLMTDPTTVPFAAPTDVPCLPYAIDAQHEASRSNCFRRTQSRMAILAGNTPLRPDYRAADRSGFSVSAAPAPPPKVLFCSSPPPRSARLGSTIPLGRPASPRLTPAPNSQMDHSPPAASPVLQYTTPDNDTSTAAEQLSHTLLTKHRT